MTSLPKLSVDNPVLVSVAMLTILVGGVYSSLTLVREMFPETTPDKVAISTVYPARGSCLGRSAERRLRRSKEASL